MRQLLAFLVKVAVSALLLYLAFARVNFHAVGQRLYQLDYAWLIAAVSIFVVQTMLGAMRWQRIVRHCEVPTDAQFSAARALRYSFIASFFNQTLPSTVGGDAVRIWLLARDQTGWRTATYSVLVDRVAGVLVLALLVIVCLPWSFALIADASGRIALLVVGFGSIAGCGLFLALGFIRWPWLDRWWLARHVLAAAAVSRSVFATSRDAALIIIWSLIIHSLSVSAAWCVAKAVAAPLEWTQALLLVLPVLLIATIPLSIAGWGTREAAMILAFGYAGLPESDGLIVSVLLGVAMFAAGLIGGGAWILDRGKELREGRQPAR